MPHTLPAQRRALVHHIAWTIHALNTHGNRGTDSWFAKHCSNLVPPKLDELLGFEPKHLAWPIPWNLVDTLGVDRAIPYLERRKERIIEAKADPLKHGYEPEIWQVVKDNIADLRAKHPEGVIKLIIWGGHRSSKTRFASNYVNTDVAAHPGRRWWCCDSTEAQARANQMRLINEQFPNEWRDLPRDAVTDLRYSISDGYPKNKLVCPNASEIDFKFYTMDLANLPGPELDGIWGDELMPLPWVKFAVFRLVNRNGTLLLTFTPEFGWNETYGYFYEGAQVISEVEAPLLPKFDEDGRQIGFKKVPRIMQCQDPLARIIYFHTSDNPFGNYPVMVQELKGKHEDEIAIRAYGVCTKAHRAAFPLFNERVHTITTAQFSDIVEEHPKTMRFHLVDPCDGRNWFMIWVACPYPDKWIIYREWPSYGHPKAYIEGVGMPGPWAVSGAAADGVRGPAQNGWGFSLSAYRDEILRVEAGEHIDGRYIDSRYSTQRRTEHERITTLQEQITEVGMDFMCMVPGKGRIVGGEGNDGSVDLINSALYYDVETDIGKYSPKLAKLNEPQLLVVDTCPNVIYGLEHWSGVDGQKGACKDPVDCVRGAFLTSVNYVPENMYSFQGGGVP